MSMFAVLSISGSGADAMQTWIDTNAGNIANMNDAVPVGTKAYAEQTPVLTPIGTTPLGQGVGAGVEVSRIAETTTKGVIAYEPTNPMANPQGEVVLPNVDLADQMVGLIAAQEGYQADTAAIQHAQQAYTAGLQIGT